MQQRGNCVPLEAHTASWSLFARRFAPLFSCSFLGLAAIRVWLQCCVYDLYAATDSGMATVAVNLTRGIVTLVLMAIFSRRVFSPRVQNRLGVASCILMTCGCVLLLAASETMTPLLGWVACVLSALGVVWGGGMWITFYERLNPEESLLYAFSALSLSCLAGLVLGFLPRPLTMLVGAFMPALSLVTFRAAMQDLDERGCAKYAPGATSCGARSLPYAREFRATFVRFLVGVALFSLALGFARGFPYGQAIELPGAMRVLHQLLTCLLCAGILWWVLVKGRHLRLSALWNMSSACSCSPASPRSSCRRALHWSLSRTHSRSPCCGTSATTWHAICTCRATLCWEPFGSLTKCPVKQAASSPWGWAPTIPRPCSSPCA